MAVSFKFYNRISDKIEEFRRNTGASRTWIAEQIGMSRQSLSALEESNNPTIQNLIKLSIILKCNVSDLFTYEVTFSAKAVE